MYETDDDRQARIRQVLARCQRDLTSWVLAQEVQLDTQAIAKWNATVFAGLAELSDHDLSYAVVLLLTDTRAHEEQAAQILTGLRSPQ